MPQSGSKQFSGIFVCYRRDDSSGHAGRLFDKLSDHFGKDRIFMDIDTIEPGEDFVTVIENAVCSCEILIAIIGRNWLARAGETSRFLDNPNDFVRVEIATALSRDIRVIPVLVQRASMPKPQDLPDDLTRLSRRNAVELSDLRWQRDVEQLIGVMERILAQQEEARRREAERSLQESLRLAQAAREAEEERQRAEAEERQRAEEQERERRETDERQRRELAEARQRLEEDKRLRAEKERSRREGEDAERQRANAGVLLESSEEELKTLPDSSAVTASTTPATGSPSFVPQQKDIDKVESDSNEDIPLLLVTRWLRGVFSFGSSRQIPPVAKLFLFFTAFLFIIIFFFSLRRTPQSGQQQSSNSTATQTNALGNSPNATPSPSAYPNVIRDANGKLTPAIGYRWVNPDVPNDFRVELKPGLPTFTNQYGIEMVYIQPGEFMMGSDNGGADEKPVHRVTINRPFYMGKYEVTQAQWKAVTGNNLSFFKDCGGNCPVENVSWNDAQKFIQRLNHTGDGYIYRLPTEAEWEYACRAGTTGHYAGELKDIAWFSENAESKTHAVGQKQPNVWGLADMNGNVWEWSEDIYHETYSGAPADGSAWLTGSDQRFRVTRGGSWSSGASCTFRDHSAPVFRNGDWGIRVVAVARTQ